MNLPFSLKNPPWVHGVKRLVAARYAGWFHEHVISVMRSRFSAIPHSGSTTETEEALGFGPSCYWYIGRADDLYGEVVFLCEAVTVGWRGPDGDMCAFDSGGMWKGKITTNPDLAPQSAARVDLVRRFSKPLLDWTASFQSYIADAYSGAIDYVRGLPPNNAPADHPIVCDVSQNQAVAWTWEARVLFARADDTVSASAAYMSISRKDELLEWLRAQEWELFTELLPWIDQNTVTPEHDYISPVVAANKLIEASLR